MRSISLQKIFTVSRRLQLVAGAKLDKLEAKLGFELPIGYREYLQTLGKGSFCHNLTVHTPEEVLDPKARSYWNESQLPSAIENEFWHDRPLLTESELLKTVVFAHSDEGDFFVSCPQRPGQLFELPRHESKMHLYSEGFLKPFKFEFCKISKYNMPFFEPPDCRQSSLGLQRGGDSDVREVWKYVDRIGPTKLQIVEGKINKTERVIAFIPDISGCAWLDEGGFYFFSDSEHACVLEELGREFQHLQQA